MTGDASKCKYKGWREKMIKLYKVWEPTNPYVLDYHISRQKSGKHKATKCV